jgi:sugar lactone lactonase YvrE
MVRWNAKWATRLICVSLVVLAGCSPAEEASEEVPAPPPRPIAPELVTIVSPGLYPEGIEYDEVGGRFLVGSLGNGTVTAVSDDGTLTTLIDEVGMTSSIGLHIDRFNSRLLVAYADPGVFLGRTDGEAWLGIYDLATGQKHHLIDLSEFHPDERHFANDVTADADGNVYVTDSFSPVVYRVHPDGTPEVFLRDDRFQNEAFGLNGIEYHPDGYLLAAVGGSAELYRIPLIAPSRVDRVFLPESFSADGIVLGPDGDLVAVAFTFDEQGNQLATVLKLRSDDRWESAEIINRVDVSDQPPTTATIRDGQVYVINAHLAEMFGAGGGPPVEQFEIVRIDFPETGTGPDE